MSDTLFPVEPTGEIPQPRDVPLFYGAPVARPPGWVLLVNRLGPLGFHRINASGMNGLVFSKCGMIGRVVEDEQQQIVLCPECEKLL